MLADNFLCLFRQIGSPKLKNMFLNNQKIYFKTLNIQLFYVVKSLQNAFETTKISCLVVEIFLLPVFAAILNKRSGVVGRTRKSNI